MFGCVLILGMGSRPAESKDKFPTLVEWISLKGADQPTISPDGRQVAYHVRSADWEADGFDDEIWVVDVASRKSYQLTNSKGPNRGQSWSPAGRQLAFLSARTGGTQIYLATPPSPEVVKLTEAPNGINDFRWSPDGRRIAFTTTEMFPKPHGDEPPEYHVVGNDAATSTSLWIVDVANPGKAERVIDGKAFAVDDLSWSPDSRRIAFSAYDYKVENTFPTYDLYVLNHGENTIQKIVSDRGPQFFPVWSPDGTQIAFRTYVLTDKDDYYYYAPGYIAVAPATGGVTRVLTQDFDEHPTPLAWSTKGIYFFARQRTYQHLFRLNPVSKAIDRVTQPYAYVFGPSFSFTPDGRQIAFMAQDATHYDELHVSSLQSFNPKRLTSFGDQIKGWKVGTREVIEWTSKDGTKIEGILIKPADFDRKKKYPLIVISHGGPLATDQAIIFRDMPYPAEMFVAKGALVLRPNYRGSTGYGRKFRELMVRDEGKGPCDDIVSGVDHLVAKGLADPKRVGALGWSAGGYLSAFLSTTSDRFKAITVGEGVPDAVLYYAVGGGTTVRPDYARATAWEDPEYYRNTSPITFVKNARTPTLIQHRESDPVAPTVGAHLFYRALKEQGVPAKLILYSGTGHVPSGLKQTRAVIEHNLEWMDQWIWRD